VVRRWPKAKTFWNWLWRKRNRRAGEKHVISSEPRASAEATCRVPGAHVPK
jgi:hypothetical protein